MIKKTIISFLMAIVVLCGINFVSITTAYAADDTSTESATLSGNEKLAHVTLSDLFPTGYTANDNIEIMDGDNEIGTLKVDKDATYGFNGYVFKSVGLYTFKPNNEYNVKKFIYVAPTGGSVVFSLVSDQPSSTYMSIEKPTTAEKELINASFPDVKFDSSNAHGVVIDSSYYNDTQNPYVFKHSGTLKFGNIFLIYEETGNYTKTHDCTNDKPTNTHSIIQVGDATFPIQYEGTFNNGYTAYGDGSFSITINPVPGYVINYVIFTSPLDNPFDEKELKYPGLEATYENGNLTVTGMQVGQTYTVYSGGGAVGLLTSITVNYQEHEHSGVYEPGSDETHHFRQCECLWRVDEEEHSFGEGEITLEPTHQRKGKAKYTCTVAECGYEKEEQVAPNFADTEVSLDYELRYNGSIQFAVYTVKYKGYEVGRSNYTVVSGVARGKEPGDYTFTIGPTPDSIFEGEKEFTFTIKKVSVAKPALDTTEFYFDNTVKTYTVENSEFYTVLDNSNQQTNPGSYKVKIALSNPDYYEWEDGTTDTLEYDFVINKGNYDMGKVVFNDLEITYDGEEHSIIATNLPDGVTVSYEDNVGTNAGTYNAIAKFTGNLDYYNPIDNKTATLTINKAVVTAPTADSTAFTYNGQAQTYALQENSHYTISDTTFKGAGNHTITVSLVDKTNYKWDNGNSNDLTYSFVIGKATYDMSGVVFADKTVTYNGTAFSLEATNLPNGVNVSYENNGKTNAGEYTIIAKFTGDSNNYNLIENKTAKLTINKLSVEKPTADSAVYTYNGEEQTYVLQASDLYNILDNKGTNAGNYTVKVVLKDKTNYKWDNGNSNDLEYSFVIGKATYNMDGVVFADKTVTYNGTAFSIEATNLPNGVTVSYENNGKTDAGEYTVTVKFTGNANYNAISDKTAILTINKATYDMRAVVFANKTVVYNGNAYSLEATNLPNGVSATYENNGKTNAGEYTVTAKFTGNANYNAIANKTATLTINKATYDMSAVVFENKTVVYNGTAHSIEATNLPSGVTVSYENNGKTDAGEYTVTAKFTGNANYNAISDKTATLTIKNASLIFNTDDENDVSDDVIISSPDGIDPTKELVVNEVEKTKNYSEFIDKNQKVAIAYDIKLLKDGLSVQPDGTLRFKVLIPEELRGKDFDIIHIHNGNETSLLEYQIDGDYVTFESNKLSDFVFVYDMGSILWVIIVLGVIMLFEIAFLVYLSKKNKQLKSKKVMSAYPPFLFGMFIAEWEIVLVIILTVVVIALAVVSIIFATKVINSKAKTSTENEEVAVAVDTDNQSIEGVKDDVDEKEGRIIKSFADRLSQCPPETIEYYNVIKSELLSYKKVKSKISFKHESFRLGMPSVARLKIKGKSLYLFLALNPNDYKDSKYKIKDVSTVSNCKDVPTMYKINLPRRAVYAKELIQDLMKKFNVEKNG